MMILCPYCGHIQQQAEQCASCKGVFEPLSRCASQIAMGPWYSVMPSRPFMPGFSYEVLCGMVARGKVKADTPIRGPGTKQLWTYAVKAPGVAHLLGRCYNCNHEVDKGHGACPSCGVEFPRSFDRNKLGLPTGSLSGTVREQLETNGDLCPCCGPKMADQVRCQTCGVVYNPPDAATRVTLGPWSLRYSSRPFYISSSLAEIKARIEAGGIKPDTIMRGPTTYQFWSMAQTVPGIAHLLGFCFSCRKEVTRGAEACPHCTTRLAIDLPPADELGLLFPTDAAVAEAQQQLDEAVAQQEEDARGGGEQPIEMPDGIEADFLPLAVDASAAAAKPAGEGMFTDAAPAAPAAPAAAAVPAAAPPADPAAAMFTDYSAPVGSSASNALEQVAAGTDDADDDEPFFAMASGGGGADAAVGGMAAAGGSGARHSIDVARTRRSKKQNPAAIAAFGLTAVFLGFVMIFLLSSNTSPDRDRPVVQEKPKPEKPRRVEEATPYQIDRKKEIEADAEKLIAATDPSKRFTPLVDAVKKELTAIKGLWNEKRFYDAEQKFHDLEKAMAAIDAMEALRGGALSSKMQAKGIAEKAKEKNAEQSAAPEWGQGSAHMAEAQRLFDAEEFEQADKVWASSFQSYQKALQRAETAIAAQESREEFLTDVVGNFSQQQIEAVGGPSFATAVKYVGEGDGLFTEGKYADALERYEKANELIPDIELAVQAIVGVHFWAVKTGYEATDALIDVNKGETFSKPVQESLRKAYNQLMVGPQFLAAIPSSEKPKLDVFAKLIFETARDNIVQNRGEVVRASYNIGVQLRLIQEILTSPGDYIERANKSAIKDKIAMIRSEAKTAGYSSEFTDVIDKLEANINIKPDFEALRVSRTYINELVEQLREYDDAMEILPEGV